MKPTGDDFRPRRDGWFEHRGHWSEVVVGTVLADPNRRTLRWEVIDTAHGRQVEAGTTLWLRVREQSSGEEHTIPPRARHGLVTILTRDPADTETGEPTAPSDADAIMLLARELGAEVMARRDAITGEVTCPDYIDESHDPEATGREIRHDHLIEHMRFAHGMSVDDDLPLKETIELHGRCHDHRHPDVGKGGFPHRHTPEINLHIGGRA